MKSSTKVWLAVILTIVLAARLYIAFQTPHLSLDAYTTVRQVEQITETGLPLYNDPLSYGGRTQIYSPLYQYFLALFNLVLPIEVVFKVIPNIIAALTVLVAFHLAKSISKNETTALLIALISGFIPVFFNNTINNGSIYNAIIPLFLLTTHYFLATNKDPKYLPHLIWTMILLTVLHPASLILAISLLIYMLLLRLQDFRESSREPEAILFFTFFVVWLNLILYQKSLSVHGATAIWQNIPSAIIQNSYGSITALQSIYTVGVIPLILGLASIYISLFTSKKKTITLLMAICLTIFLMIWLRAIELTTGFIFLGAALTAISAYSLGILYENSKILKISKAPTILVLIIILLLAILFIPNISVAKKIAGETPTQKDINAYIWIKENTPANSTIMVLPEEASAMSYYANRPNVIDDNYLLISDVNRRYYDATNVWNDVFITSALEKLNYYSVKYIILTEHNQNTNNIRKPAFIPHACATQVYPYTSEETGPKIYRINCGLIQKGGQK